MKLFSKKYRNFDITSFWIEPEDIKFGICSDPECCPLSLRLEHVVKYPIGKDLVVKSGTMGSSIFYKKKVLHFQHDHFLKEWVKKFDNTAKAYRIKIEYVMRGEVHLLRIIESDESIEYVGLKKNPDESIEHVGLKKN